MATILVPFMLAITTCLASSSHRWDYSTGDTGPANWKTNYPVCSGSRQSPVNLVTTKDVTYPSLKLSHYDVDPGQAHLINNGHTVKLTTNPTSAEKIPILESGGLPAKYKFQQVHFHWGSEIGKGSEHQVNGKSYPMEMHLVHYKATHNNLVQALEESANDSLAVLGVFFEVADSPNPGIAKLIPRLPEIKRKTNQKLLDAPKFPISLLLDGVDLNSFYRYEGSLTTPSCNEIVQWTVLKNPIKVTNQQIEAFRNLQDAESSPLENNFRPIQKLGTREIFSNRAGRTDFTWIVLTLIPCLISKL